ncbi:glycosyltransferase [uncultured Selenomonas sp.]|uniref:glycosyltransferase n=1 Tax=uncultured Selenomonas sp. TaxID=159275 RepID=UPI0025D1503E|nr:glycosyltransferase [uncultured Selenomonas sp.]
MINYHLQNLLLPVPSVCAEKSMYYRKFGDVLQDGQVLRFGKHAVCTFSTYFNSFSLNKWQAYTGLDNLGLSLCLAGTFSIEIYAAEWYRGRIQKHCLLSETVTCDEKTEVELQLSELAGENICFTLCALTEGAEFYGGSYTTEIDAARLHPVEIDLVMCTFRRERFVERNVRLIEQEFFQNPRYNGAAHFHVKIVDNGRTLPASVTQGDDRIRLYPNKNVGGSGGFTRGMMESLYEGRATHILFMDDDVTVQVEAFERTYNLLTLLKKEYQNRFLAGAMLRLDQPNRQHASRECMLGKDILGLKTETNLSLYRNVVFNEKYESAPKEYASWWYCCIPKSIARLDNLPLPFFVRFDDIEYSTRNIDRVLALNGIAVWHAPFDRKYSVLMEHYFMFRNQMVSILLHDSVGRMGFLKYFLRHFAREVLRYDYASAGLLMDGVEMVLEGPDAFIHCDTGKDLKEHAAKQTKSKPLSEYTSMVIRYQDFQAALQDVGESMPAKIFRFLTFNGHLLPDCCFRPQNYAAYGYEANSKHFYRYRKVLACDPNFEEGALFELDRTKCFRALLRWGKDALRIAFGWKRLQKSYRDAFPYMTSDAFWRKYLELDEEG